MKPTDDHSRKRDKDSSQSQATTTPTQTWQKSGTCPNGTVPILRVQRHHLLNAPSIQNYGRKPWNGVVKHEIRSSNRTIAAGIEGLHAVGPPQTPFQFIHKVVASCLCICSSDIQYAVLIGSGYNYIGAKASLGIYNPWVEGDDEYSTCQIWLRHGGYNNSESIEVGWMVSALVYTAFCI